MPIIPSGSPLSISDLEPLLKDTSNVRQVFFHIASVFNSNSLTMEQKFYGVCFLYVILVEGIYDQVLRYLLLWWENCQGNRPDVQSESIYAVKRELEAAGASAILFDGWEPRIRNSIAHMRFSYGALTNKAIFDDVDPRDPTNTFHTEMNYNQFGEMGMNLYNIVFLVQTILVMGNLVPMILIAAEKC